MGRRRCQQPSVFRTKSKRPEWYFRARVDVLVAPGKTERVEKTYYLGYADEMGKRQAENARNTVLTESINKPALLIQSQVKFSDLLAAYRRDHIPTLRKVTASGYESYVKRIDTDLGSKRLCDLTPQVLQVWANGLPAASRHQFVTHFNIAWKKARAWGYTTMPTPAEFISYSRKPVHHKSIPTMEQYMRLRAGLKSPLDDMADCAVMMGLRVSEIRGLCAKNVDLATGCVRVEQRLDQLDEVDDPKSKKSLRALPIGTLRPMFERILRTKSGDDLLFDSPSYSWCQRKLVEAAEKAGCSVEKFGWHTLRRCHNTWLRKSGASAHDAMDQMGHTSQAVNDLYLVVESEDYQRREKLIASLHEQLMGTPKGPTQ